MEESKRMPPRPRPIFPIPPKKRRSDPIISFLRHNKVAVFLYTWLTDTLVTFVLAVVIVVPVGAVLLLFYLPKFCRNWKRRRDYGVKVIPLHENTFVFRNQVDPRFMLNR
jgi:hypothetical protein